MGYSVKVLDFAVMVHKDEIRHLEDMNCTCETNLRNVIPRVVDGKKYVKVDVGSSGKYMIDKETEEIFGIKAYGQIHRGHRYGTLDAPLSYYGYKEMAK